MSSPAVSYIRVMHAKTTFYAAWLPNAPLSLGDVGRVKAREFQRETSLTNLRVNFKPIRGAPGQDISHTSGSGVKIAFKAAGQPLPGAGIPLGKAGAAVTFDSSGAFLFQATSPVQESIDDLHALGNDLIRLWRDRVWKEDWCVVTTLVRVKTLTVLIANNRNAGVELTAEGPLSSGDLALARADAALSVSRPSADVTQVLAARGATPLFHIRKLRRGLLDRFLGRSPDFGRAAGPSDAPDATGDFFDPPLAPD